MIQSSKKSIAAEQWEKGCDLYEAGKKEEAAELWYEAAENGHARAQWQIGDLYEWGDIPSVIPQDINKAIEWYTKSASQGDANGMYSLADCYMSGQVAGVDAKTSKERAIELFECAAANGNPLAQYRAGINYTVEKENLAADWRDKAFAWFQKAAGQDENIKAKAGALYQLGSLYHPDDLEQPDNDAEIDKAINCYTEALKLGLDEISADDAQIGLAILNNEKNARINAKKNENRNESKLDDFINEIEERVIEAEEAFASFDKEYFIATINKDPSLKQGVLVRVFNICSKLSELSELINNVLKENPGNKRLRSIGQRHLVTFVKMNSIYLSIMEFNPDTKKQSTSLIFKKIGKGVLLITAFLIPVIGPAILSIKEGITNGDTDVPKKINIVHGVIFLIIFLVYTMMDSDPLNIIFFFIPFTIFAAIAAAISYFISVVCYEISDFITRKIR